MLRNLRFKDPKQENRLIGQRIYFAGITIFLLIMILVGRIFYLQVIQHDHFSTLSRHNQVQIRPLPPIRGLIFSSDNVLLADNRPSFSLEIVPESITLELDALIAELRNYIRIDELDITRYQELARKKRRFESIPLRLDLTDEEVARFSVNRHRFKGVDVVAGLSRYYPIGENLAHVVGYVGRIDKNELENLDTSDYSGTTHIGKLGVEKAYEEILHGSVGYEQVEVNVQGRVIRELETTPPVPGKNIYLSLNVSLQNLAIAELGDRRGSVVAIDPRTGEILALVSTPGYDPNLFVNGIDSKSYNRILNSRDTPLLNRSLQGTYPPGSTIKPFIAFSALNNGVRTPGDETWCPGWYRLPGVKQEKRDWKKEGHGHMNMKYAIANSCDVYFYALAYEMGIDLLHDDLQKFGFGRHTGIDIGGEVASLMPSQDWKRRSKDQAWYPGDTVNVGIGQGFMLATPLQLASATATLASRGRVIEPHLLAEIRDPVTDELLGKGEIKSRDQVVANNQEYWDEVINAMVEVVHGAQGTARASGRGAEYRFAGKTGTAQVFSLSRDQSEQDDDIPEELKDHALFIAFAPVDAPEIALSILVENGGGGSSTAAPIARRLLDHWFGVTKKD